MSPPVSTATLYADVKVLDERVSNLQAEVAGMKTDITKVKSDVKEIATDLWNVRVRISAWAAGAGVLTSVLLKVMDHFWKT
jgi:uncharacterized small protein (DUF1192 family)